MEKDTLESIVLRQIEILRQILTNVAREQKALAEMNIDLLNSTIEERLDMLEVYEVLEAKLRDFAVNLASKTIAGFSGYEASSPKENLELLDGLLPAEEIDLKYDIEQLKFLIDEVQNQNKLTLEFLQSKNRTFFECKAEFKNPLRITDGPYRVKPKKTTVTLMDADEILEEDT